MIKYFKTIQTSNAYECTNVPLFHCSGMSNYPQGIISHVIVKLYNEFLIQFEIMNSDIYG